MISVVVCSADEAKFAAVARMYANALAGAAHEVVRVADARSLAEGYRRGIASARGEILALSHDDVEVLSPDLPGRLRQHLADYNLIGVAGTTRLAGPGWLSAGPPYIFGQVAHPMPPRLGKPPEYSVDVYGAPAPVVPGVCGLDGLFLAMRRAVAEAVPFDAATFDGFHLYDLDFTFAAHRAGFRLAVCNDIHLLHHSPGHFDDVRWEEYARRFVQKWAAHLPQTTTPPRRFKWATVIVNDRKAILEVMNPPHWR